ncbi:Processing alpha glucosidase I, partial [Linderina macrospora]
MRILAIAIGLTAATALGSDFGTTQGELDSSLLWGTYRPNLYFGTRPRIPNSLLTGLMWFGMDDPTSWQRIRHSCELGDNLAEYGYSRHNGRDFGEQTMRDNDQAVEIRSQFIKVPGEYGGSWAARISGKTLGNGKEGAALMYYFGLEGNGTMKMTVEDDVAVIRGQTEELGKFTVRVVPAASNKAPRLPKKLRRVKGLTVGQKISGIAMNVPGDEVWKAKDFFSEHLLSAARKHAQAIDKLDPGNMPLSGAALFSLDNTDLESGGNLLFAQMIVKGEFTFDVIYECSDKSARIDEGTITAVAGARRKEFDARFEHTFGLESKGFDAAHVEMARSALSSLLGGIGYFYGSGLVSPEPKPEHGDSDVIAAPELGAPYSLFATTPSRPFFPRGFLWDEGFSQLLVGQWDNDLSMQVLLSWRNTSQDGWIAREQILGSEARSKVPVEFQVQYPNFANPPTLLFNVEAFMRHREEIASLRKAAEGGLVELPASETSQMLLDHELADRMMLELGELANGMLEYFLTTQRGSSSKRASSKSTFASGFRWRGRTESHTLTSGLDDYPRASPPSTGELHLDLHAWVAYMQRLSDELALQGVGDGKPIADQAIKALDELHWNEDEKMYCDVTMRANEDYDELEDDEGNAETVEFVCHRGYVSLLPMLLGLVPAESPKLGHILDMIEDPEELWTEFGLRSLSKSDEFYGKGENYWRGPIWININYLVLSSLHTNYMPVEGPFQKQAARIYSQLRTNLIANIFKQYEDTRFFWEQYNPETGAGKGTHPFTGWTTL